MAASVLHGQSRARWAPIAAFHPEEAGASMEMETLLGYPDLYCIHPPSVCGLQP